MPRMRGTLHLRSGLRRQIDHVLEKRDACERCHGERGGVPGNENVVNGVVLCDYCCAEDLLLSQQPKARVVCPSCDGAPVDAEGNICGTCEGECMIDACPDRDGPCYSL